MALDKEPNPNVCRTWPVLICRTAEGKIRAFENSCAHRGAQVVATGRGNAKRFVCPYHAWSYNNEGALKRVLCEGDFGEVERDSNSLVELPCLERAGLIWVTLDSQSSLRLAIQKNNSTERARG